MPGRHPETDARSCPIPCAIRMAAGRCFQTQEFPNERGTATTLPAATNENTARSGGLPRSLRERAGIPFGRYSFQIPDGPAAGPRRRGRCADGLYRLPETRRGGQAQPDTTADARGMAPCASGFRGGNGRGNGTSPGTDLGRGAGGAPHTRIRADTPGHRQGAETSCPLTFRRSCAIAIIIAFNGNSFPTCRPGVVRSGRPSPVLSDCTSDSFLRPFLPAADLPLPVPNTHGRQS